MFFSIKFILSPMTIPLSLFLNPNEELVSYTIPSQEMVWVLSTALSIEIIISIFVFFKKRVFFRHVLHYPHKRVKSVFSLLLLSIHSLLNHNFYFSILISVCHSFFVDSSRHGITLSSSHYMMLFKSSSFLYSIQNYTMKKSMTRILLFYIRMGRSHRTYIWIYSSMFAIHINLY